MSQSSAVIPSDVPLVAVAVGNTRARVGLFRGPSLVAAAAVVPDGPDAESVIRGLAEREAGGVGAVLVSSVADDRAAMMERVLGQVWPGVELFRIGRDLPIPIRHTLRDPSTVGMDRLLNALAAYRRAEQACAVIDVGTAVTVDFVDGEGTFHGGAIAPGLNMMLRSLSAGTAQLPDISFAATATEPEPEPDAAKAPFGGDTPEAMRVGVAAAVRGLVRDLVERYAEFYGAFPQVVATGGDMGVLEGDGLVEHFVPDLQLLGIQAVAQASVSADDAGDA